MKKRLVAMLLVLAMTLSLVSTSVLAAVNPNSFSDVSTEDWFYREVQYVYRNKLIDGTSAATFAPNVPASRGVIVKALWRLAGSPTASGEYFQDVKKGSEYEQAVSWAAENGIVNGYEDNTFRPNASVTRQELAAILYRFATYRGQSTQTNGNLSGYEDYAQVAEYAKIPLAWANEQRLILGMTEQTLAPKGTATRAQFAAILYRMKDKQQVIEGAESALYLSAALMASAPVIGSGAGRYYTVNFDSNGGSTVESQQVKEGETVQIPSDPKKEGFAFIGWYLGGEGYTACYNFSAALQEDLTLYAKWFDATDTADSDNDGLSDSLEIAMGSDPCNPDTDYDGVSDYYELNWLNYDPTVSDSDGNGVADKDEDPDQDGLTNAEEEHYGTIPICADSDFDGLSDGDEVNVYHTDPLKADTDGDGVPDGMEIAIGSNPLVAETSFQTSAGSATPDTHTPVTASAQVTSGASGVGSLQVSEMSPQDSMLLSSTISGYLGSAYQFQFDGKFSTARLTFHYDPSLGTIGENFQPRIYYLNEETGLLEELPNQTVENGKVSADVTHFSCYILLNKVEFDKVWEQDIKTPQDQENPQYTGIDVVFVIDSSGSMTRNDKNGIRKTAAKAFVAKLTSNDRAAVIDFDSSATVYRSFTSDHDDLNTAIDRVNSSGGTSLSAGIGKAIDQFTSDTYTRTDAYKYIIFLTDGDGSYDTSYTTTAKNNGIVIYTIGLGSGVKESTLKAIAEGTGGKYYFASTADALSGIYEDVSFETVDYTTDSNGDGISDYYTKLLNDGNLPLSSGCFDLVGVTDMYGADCDDWDGDGLKNGEEIEVCVSGSRIYVKMKSHPLLVDTDEDGFSDSEEVRFGTPPMEYTSMKSSLDILENDSSYLYIGWANDRSWIANVNAFFDWKKTDEATAQFLNYFYDYASKDTIDQNQEKIAALKKQEEYLKYAQSAANVVKSAKSICGIFDSIEPLANGLSDTGKPKEYIDGLKNHTIELKDTAAQLNLSRKELLEIINTKSFKQQEQDVSKNIVKDIVKNIENAQKTVEEFKDLAEDFEELDDMASVAKELSEKLKTLTGTASTAVSIVKKCVDNFKYMKLADNYKPISSGYHTWVERKPGLSMSDKVGIVINVAEGGLEIWENCNTYAKVKANREAYLAYTDLLYYISEHAAEEYDRIAANNVAETVADITWTTYEQQLFLCNAKTIVWTALDIAVDLIPYAKVAKATWDAVYTISGLGSNAKLYVSTRTMQAISDGCKSILNQYIRQTGMGGKFFSYAQEDYGTVNSYIVQLAQSRLVGENYVRERMQEYDSAVLISQWFVGMTDDEIEKLFRTRAGLVYDCASDLGVVLSDKLPYYSDFHKTQSDSSSGAGNGGGGGGGSR